MWNTCYPIAESGIRQSPVDIVTDNCCENDSEGGLKFEYEPCQVNLKNCGHTWRMEFSPDAINLSGSPIGGDFKVFVSKNKT